MAEEIYEVWSVLYKEGGGSDLIFPSSFVGRLAQLGRELFHYNDEVSAIKNIRFIMYLNIDPSDDNISKQYHNFLENKGLDGNEIECVESKDECTFIETKDELKEYLCSLVVQCK